MGRMDNFSEATLAIAMMAAFLLLGGGAKLALKRQTRGRGILMMIAALVLVMNVMILTV
jgi:high-affinity Fe2+/Pb2+ permease